MFSTLLVNSVQASYQLRKTQKSLYKPLDFVQTLPSMAGWQLGLVGWLIQMLKTVCLVLEAWNPYPASVNEYVCVKRIDGWWTWLQMTN